jgi:hypothetical protein
MNDGAMALIVIFFVWNIIAVIQMFFGYGTAYRLTKRGSGDNGVALFGWLLVFALAAWVPGLGIYFWFKYRTDENQLSKFRQQ